MKRLLFISVAISLALTYSNGFGQKSKTNDYLTQLPEKWKLVETNPVSYLVTTTHYDYSMMGPFIQRTRITGEFSRGLKDGYVKWNNVEIAHSSKPDGPFDKGVEQKVMENFTYVPSEKMLQEEMFKDFPPDANNYLLKNLVWDMMAFESFARDFTDSLQLNKEFHPKSGGEMNLAGQGTFENKDMRLTWIGITEKNDQLCAIIKYSVMNNPLTMNSDQLKMKGRSHYWGNVYVSLKTKQLEYAEMYEDVIMDLKFSGQDNSQMMNTIRTIFVEKIQK